MTAQARQRPARREAEPARPARRRRGAALEAAILDAAWEELAASGYAGLTMDAVAARAGTSKPVLYRRWPARAELVLAAMRRKAPTLSGEAPDTGSLRGDVLALLRRMSASLAGIRQEAIWGLLADYFGDPERFPVLQAQVLQAGAQAMTTILGRAAQRGEAPATLPPRVVTLPVDLARHELLITRGPVPDSVLIEIVDQIFLPLVGGAP
jgi:AcrR family transcriptional regulator